MKISEKLYRAAREMQARPWCRGQMFSAGDMGVGLDKATPSTGCCALGAIALVSPGGMGDVFDPDLLRYCRDATGGLPLSTFNDRVARSKHDVIKVLREAANEANRDFK